MRTPIAPRPSRATTPLLFAGCAALSLALTLAPTGTANAAPSQGPDSVDPEDDVARYQSTLSGLDSPRAVAIDERDLVWVVESGAARVRAFDAAGEERMRIEGTGLAHPGGIAVAAGLVYVADTGNHRVEVFDVRGPEPRWIQSIGKLGSAPGHLHSPAGLAANEERLYVCDPGNGRVQIFARGESKGAGQQLAGHQLIGELKPQAPFEKPIDVALDSEGRVVVGDAGSYRCIVFDPQGRETGRFGDVGWFPGLFSLIGGVAISRDRIYVADAENHRVQEFSFAGELLLKWGLHAIRPREGRGKLHYPAHLTISPSGKLAAIAEPYDDRVQLFGPGNEIVEGGDVFRQNSTQPSPHYGFRASGSGNWLAVAEPETHELLIFDTQIDTPRLVSRVGGYGDRMGLFHSPSGVHLDGDSQTVIATERDGRRLQAFELQVDPQADVAFDREMARFVRMLDFDRLEGRFAGTELEYKIEPTAITRDGDSQIYLIDARNERILVLSPKLVPLRSFGGHGTELGKFRRPTDITLDPSGERVYVVDSGNRRVQAFTIAGRALFAFDGSPGERFVDPFGIAMGANGRIFVTDTGSDRLLWFDAEGKPAGAMGGRGIQRSRFYKPRDVEIDGRGRVVVIDHGNHRAQLFSSDGEYLDCFGARLYTRPARLPETYDPADYKE